MIAPAKPNRIARAIARQEAEADLVVALTEPPKPDGPIAAKKPRLRGRARAQVAKKVAAVIEGPSSKKVPTLSPGVVLTRTYRGKRITVKVLGERRFESNGKTYRSLSAIANEVSGTHCNGVAWFGLRARAKKEASS